MTFIVRIIASALAIWLCTLILPGINAAESTSTSQAVLYFLVLGAIFTLVTMIIRPIIVVLSIPLYILTLGLFSIIVNAIVLLISNWIGTELGWGLAVDGFGWAILGGIVIAIALMIIDLFLPRSVRR